LAFKVVGDNKDSKKDVLLKERKKKKKNLDFDQDVL
jgi:hypothetical protein